MMYKLKHWVRHQTMDLLRSVMKVQRKLGYSDARLKALHERVLVSQLAARAARGIIETPTRAYFDGFSN